MEQHTDLFIHVLRCTQGNKGGLRGRTFLLPQGRGELVLEGIIAPSPPGSHRSQAGKEWGGRAKGPIEKPSVVMFFPGATFRGNWGNSPRNGLVADPFLPVWVQGREAPSGLEYQGPFRDEADTSLDTIPGMRQIGRQMSCFLLNQ